METLKFKTKRTFKTATRNNLIGWAFIAPLAVYFIIFQLLPMILAFFFSLTDWNGYSADYSFVWFENYWTALTDRIMFPEFWDSIATTFYYVLLTVPASLVLSIVIAAMLNSKIKGERLFKTCFYIPAVTAGVAISAMWLYLIDPSRGLVKVFNDWFGTNYNLLGSRATALPTLAVMSIWGGLGYNVLIILSAMKNINTQLYEACEIDGGGVFKKFFQVTLPGIAPTLFFVVITSTIGGLQAFDQMRLMTNGAFETTTIMLQIYKLYNNSDQVGLASAMSYLLFLIIVTITFIQNIIFPSGGDEKIRRRRRGGGNARKLMLELQKEKAL